MTDYREIPPDELKKIFEEHRKWVESEGKEGEKADLRVANLQMANLFDANLQEANLIGANLQEANLRVANLQEADLSGANLREADLLDANLQGANLGTDLTFGIIRNLTAPQVKKAKNWELAFYDKDFLKELGLPPDHNETLYKKLAELGK